MRSVQYISVIPLNISSRITPGIQPLDYLNTLGASGTLYNTLPPIQNELTCTRHDSILRMPIYSPFCYAHLAVIQGLKEVCDVKPGETLVVSGAAGSVGSIVCQLGKRLGAKVIAIAGNDDKCEWLEKELGVDKALNYKSPSFRKDFREIGYLDAFFDNVGGEILSYIAIS